MQTDSLVHLNHPPFMSTRLNIMSAGFQCLSFGLEILCPYAELISHLLPDRDRKQFAASLGLRPKILSIHGNPVAFLPPSLAE